MQSSAPLNLNQLSLVVLAFGMANFFGTTLAGYLMTLRVIALLMSATALLLVSFTDVSYLAAACVALWVLAFSSMPTGWSTWISRAVPDDAESGGWMFDLRGAGGVFLASGMLILLAAVTIFTRVRHHD